MGKTNACERVDDLIGFLYGELSEGDAQRFEHHLRDCAACEAEFRAFGQIRASMVEWRDESLGARSPAFSEQPLLAQAKVPVRVRAKPSAIAALREFFALSPLWMRGAALVATLLFCLCAVLAVAYLKGQQPTVVLVAPDTGSSQREIEEQVAREVQKRLKDVPVPKQNQLANQTTPNPKRTINHSSISPRSENAGASRPFTRRERQELATDLRLVTTKEEDDLDLTTDSNRPTP